MRTLNRDEFVGRCKKAGYQVTTDRKNKPCWVQVAIAQNGLHYTTPRDEAVFDYYENTATCIPVYSTAKTFYKKINKLRFINDSPKDIKTQEKEEMAYVSIARASSVDKASETTYPVYGSGVYLDCTEAKTIDEIREIFRNAEPINLTEGEKIGIMRTDVGVKHYMPMDSNLIAITIDFDEVTVSMCEKVYGISGTKFIVDTGKEVRSLYANATFFCLKE